MNYYCGCAVQPVNNRGLCTDECKEMLLRPKNSLEAYCKSLKLNIEDTEPTEYFVCNNLINCRKESTVLISTFKNKRCRCGNMLDQPISLQSSHVSNGFVKSNVTFLITDDLKVVPNSLDTSILLFKNFGIESMSSVNEMTVTITKNQVMDLLKGCLLSKTTLTDSFLENIHFSEKSKEIEFPPFEMNVSSKINVKVMQKKSSGKILFAQGEEDFADFLFSFLTFPLGGVVHLMKGCSSMGSVDGLYKSIVDLDERYWTTKKAKNKLLQPGLAPQQFSPSNQLLPIHDCSKYFCYTEIEYDSYHRDFVLSACYLTSAFKQVNKNKKSTCTALEFVDFTSAETGKSKGYAKGPTMYMATDDLVVMPVSSTFVTSALTSLSIPFSDLEVKDVAIGIKEGVSILQASLTSKSALTTGLNHLLIEVINEEN